MGPANVGQVTNAKVVLTAPVLTAKHPRMSILCQPDSNPSLLSQSDPGIAIDDGASRFHVAQYSPDFPWKDLQPVKIVLISYDQSEVTGLVLRSRCESQTYERVGNVILELRDWRYWTAEREVTYREERQQVRRYVAALPVETLWIV